MELKGQPLVVSYGMGVDSTAILVGLVNRGIRPDKIMFADVGAEKAETYGYLPIINAYLERNGFPTVTVVRYTPTDFKHWPPYGSLEENCLTNGTLPSISFGFSSCSQKWKAAPQHAQLKKWAPAQALWNECALCGHTRKAHRKGTIQVEHKEKTKNKRIFFCADGQRFTPGKVVKAIGYDCGTRDSKRKAKADRLVTTYKDQNAEFYTYWYPLQDWGWDRDECKRQIEAAGLPVPMKSSCYFCIAMKPEEVAALPADKLRRIVLIEARAKPRLTKSEGLWRSSRKKAKLPGSMTEFIRQRGLLPEEEIKAIQNVPDVLISFQKDFAAGLTNSPLGRFLAENFPTMYAHKPTVIEMPKPRQLTLFDMEEAA